MGKLTKRFWNNKDLAYLKKHYPNTQSKKIADCLGVSVRSVYAQANLLGLKKTAEYLKTPEAGGFQKGSKTGASFRFPKGHVPVNKGKKQTDFMSADAIAKTVATRFKPGQKIHNEKNILKLSIQQKRQSIRVLHKL